MQNIYRFLEDDNRRLFEIDEIRWIKRVYTEKGIVFECVEEPSTQTLIKKPDVLEWFEKIK